MTGPLAFLFLLLFVIFSAPIIMNSRWLRFFVLTLSLPVVANSVGKFQQIHSIKYDKLARDQKYLSEFFSQIETNVPTSGQLLIFYNNSLIDVAYAYNHWSTYLIQLATGRKDITGLIGRQSNMNDDPFAGSYADHDKKYWTKSKKKTLRKKMFGLDENRPLQIWDLSNYTARQLFCIHVRDPVPSSSYYYSIDENGIAIKSNEKMSLGNCAIFSKK